MESIKPTEQLTELQERQIAQLERRKAYLVEQFESLMKRAEFVGDTIDQIDSQILAVRESSLVYEEGDKFAKGEQ